MSLLNPTINRSAETTVYVLLAESVQGEKRKLLEAWLAQMPGLRQVRLRIDGAEHIVFETAPARAAMLIASLPATMKGFLLTRIEHQVRKDLCPAIT